MYRIPLCWTLNYTLNAIGIFDLGSKSGKLTYGVSYDPISLVLAGTLILQY